MIKHFLDLAARGDSVYLPDVRCAFSGAAHSVDISVLLVTGEIRAYRISFPDAESPMEQVFLREYLHANVYNLLSVLGGRQITLTVNPEDKLAKELCAELDEVFQTSLPLPARSGYGKSLNVTDRVNAALGFPPFRFEIREGHKPETASDALQHPSSDAVGQFRKAVQRAETATLCGMDIGGTDIKMVGVRDGRVVAFREYDWNPSRETDAEAILYPILHMVRVIRHAMTLSDTGRAGELRRAMLDKDACYAATLEAVQAADAEFGEPVLLDGLGVCFPDVVIRDKLAGGETLKTRALRAHSKDYERDFARLTGLNDLLRCNVRAGGAVRIANDGSLAAYTAAVELAHSPQADEVKDGAFAHTLGTELGAGWIDERGEIPDIPLEVYNCIIDLGDHPARAHEPLDARSLLNFNTALPGTLQKYCSQSGAYRLAIRYFEESAPERLAELYEKGYLVNENGGVYVATEPKDMRKAFLEHLMALAEESDPAASRVFEKIGEYLAVTWAETEYILAPKAKDRVLFGRFIKRLDCFERMRSGASTRSCGRLVAAGDDMAFTPLMLDLKADPTYTVAQFGQAVGAAYFAASALTSD
jgi:hypothetical protein